MFLGSSTRKHAESYGNYVQKFFLEPKHDNFDEKSDFGHVYLPRPDQEDKSLSAKQVFAFIFQKLHLSIFY